MSSRGGFSNRGRGSFSARGRGGFQNNQGPPDSVLEMGQFVHPCEGEMVCKRSETQAKIPYFNAPIYLENKTQIGKVDEILGSLNEVYFTVKLEQGVVASSFKAADKVYIGADKLLPLERFLPKPKAPGGKVEKPLNRQGMVSKPTRGRGGMRGGARGGRGGRGGAPGRGGFGGAPGRGGFSSRGAPRGRGGRGH